MPVWLLAFTFLAVVVVFFIVAALAVWLVRLTVSTRQLLRSERKLVEAVFSSFIRVAEASHDEGDDEDDDDDDDEDQGDYSALCAIFGRDEKSVILPIPPTEVGPMSTASVKLTPSLGMDVVEVVFPGKELGTQVCLLRAIKLARSGGVIEEQMVAGGVSLSAMTECHSDSVALPRFGCFRLRPGESIELEFSNPTSETVVVRGYLAGPPRED
jgi:hypothetical protein